MDEPPESRSFDEPRPALEEGLERASTALVCLDFDGTLAPIVEEPSAASITPENRRALEGLIEASDVRTAIVTGRSLADVRSRVSLPITYAGNHGLELYRDGSRTVHPIAKRRARTVETACDALERELEPIPNVRVENKRLTGTVHFRSVPESDRDRAERIARSVVAEVGGEELETSPGKEILEFSPAVPWGKGDAVRLLAESCPGEPLVCYVGDDVTDESAFRVVEPEGVGVHVGDAGASAASCRVESPDEVASLLGWLRREAPEKLADEAAATPPAAVGGSD